MCFLQIIKSSKAIVFTIPSCPQKIKNFYKTGSYGTLMDRHSFDDYYLAMKDESGNYKAATLILIKKELFKFIYHNFIAKKKNIYYF